MTASIEFSDLTGVDRANPGHPPASIKPSKILERGSFAPPGKIRLVGVLRSRSSHAIGTTSASLRTIDSGVAPPGLNGLGSLDHD